MESSLDFVELRKDHGPGKTNMIAELKDQNENRSIHLAVEAIITSVNELENTITYDLTLIAEWNEPSLIDTSLQQQQDSSLALPSLQSHKYRSIEDESTIPWKCEFIFFNEKESTTTESTFYLNKATGSVVLIKNWNIAISQLLDLHAFPCDRQMLKIKFIVLDVENVHPYNESVGRPSVLNELIGRTGLKSGMQVSSWHLHACDLRIAESGDADEPECEATFEVFVQRNSFFYCVNFGTVLFLILLCALTVAAIDYSNFSDRMGVTLNLLLTMVAFKFVMTSYVPPTSYLTLLGMAHAHTHTHTYTYTRTHTCKYTHIIAHSLLSCSCTFFTQLRQIHAAHNWYARQRYL